MAVVAGVDFGTLSVRVSIFDSGQGRLGSATAEYPLVRKKEDPDHATQSHRDHMEALAKALRKAVQAAGVRGEQIGTPGKSHAGNSYRLASSAGPCVFAQPPVGTRHPEVTAQR